VMVGPTDEWLDESGSLDGVPGVVPLGRTVSHEDVAAAVSALVGPDLTGLTGQAVIVDGGWLAHGWRRD
jgi:enoyl-[acyl-carrier-protein] reductase (NADH)